MQAQAYLVAAPGLRGRCTGRSGGAWKKVKQMCQLKGAVTVWLH